MPSITLANGTAYDLFSDRFILINRALGHAAPQVDSAPEELLPGISFSSTACNWPSIQQIFH